MRTLKIRPNTIVTSITPHELVAYQVDGVPSIDHVDEFVTFLRTHKYAVTTTPGEENLGDKSTVVHADRPPPEDFTEVFEVILFDLPGARKGVGLVKIYRRTEGYHNLLTEYEAHLRRVAASK